MILAELRDGDRVFIDANIFIYHFGGRSPQCKTFLERCARREPLGYTATPVLAEVLHRLMVAEAITKGLVTSKTAVIRALPVSGDGSRSVGCSIGDLAAVAAFCGALL